MPLSYNYFTTRMPGGISISVLPTDGGGNLNDPDNAPYAPPVAPLSDDSNPLYNFKSDFVTQFQKLTPERLNEAEPFISLQALDDQGEVAVNFNTTYFLRTVDYKAMSSQARYSDRPIISLQGIEIDEDLAAGGGFLTYTKVTLTIKIHKPDFIANNALCALLFSGTPMRIGYGWTTIQPTGGADDFLGTNDVFLFSVVDYGITFDEVGSALLTINGMSYSDRFATIYVGDEAVHVESSEIQSEDEGQLGEVSDPIMDGLARQQHRLKQFITYMDAPENQIDTTGTRDKKVMDVMTQDWYSVADQMSLAVRKNYDNAREALRAKIKKDSTYFPDVARKNSDGSSSQCDYVTVHDIVSTLCGDTLVKLQGTIIPANRDYRIVYGCFNENAGPLAGDCVANFPIHWRTWTAMLDQAAADGIPVPSLEFIFNKLTEEYICSTTYWRSTILQGVTPDNFDVPAVHVRVTSHFTTAKANASGDRTEAVQISLVDINQDVPLTQAKLQDVSQPMSEQDQITACIGDPAVIPVIKFGSANSFVQSFQMQSLDDRAFKAVLMNRAYNTVKTVRQSFTPGSLAPPFQKQTPFIPFKGSMQVLGHVEWKPARFFYLSSGIFFIDGVYAITRVHHSLDAGGFSTRIEFTRH